jgi:hypothetical protein
MSQEFELIVCFLLEIKALDRRLPFAELELVNIVGINSKKPLMSVNFGSFEVQNKCEQGLQKIFDNCWPENDLRLCMWV